MEFIWIFFAFACGLACKLVSLPPLIGFLAAGFMLNAMGVEPNSNLTLLADLGITLMLFTIGLKLNIRQLFKPEVWAGTAGPMVIWVSLFSLFGILYATIGISYFASIDWQQAALIGFALSFSSTVCIVKMLEEGGEMKTRHGKLAIAILVMQDILAVVFLALATGKIPSVYAIGLLALPLVRPLIDKLINAAGHGELLPLTGFFLALGGYELFTLVGVKGDLGALVLGLLLSSHIKASELAKALLGFKDLFLIGFFLSIGFTALPTFEMLSMALFICLLIPFKFIFYYLILTRLKLRGRTAYLSGLSLSNYSEFGLIVVALAVGNAWVDEAWLVILAIAVSISFVVSSICYKYAHRIYTSNKSLINRFESEQRLSQDVYKQPAEATVLVVGMGRVGKGSYVALRKVFGEKVWGIDAEIERVHKLQQKGYQVICADAEDVDFWGSIELSKIKLIMLAVPSIDDIANICEQLSYANYPGKIATIARFGDNHRKLSDSGVDHVFNFYAEAGAGFAQESMRIIESDNN